MYAYFTFKLYLNLKIFNSVNLVSVNEHTLFVTSQSKENGWQTRAPGAKYAYFPVEDGGPQSSGHTHSQTHKKRIKSKGFPISSLVWFIQHKDDVV